MHTAPVTLVHGFPGSGKSSAIADAIGRDGLRPAVDDGGSGEFVWVACDVADQDPRRLLGALVTGISRAVGSTSVVTALERVDLIAEMLADAPPLLIVIDGADRAGDTLGELEPLVDRLPPDIRLVITTSRRLPFHLEHMNAGGHLNEILQPDLEFTPEEIATLVERDELDLEPGMVSSIHTNTDGWIAPIALVLDVTELRPRRERRDQLALLASDDPSAPIPPVVRRYFAELIREVGGSDSLGVLSDLARLGVFGAADCRAVLGETSAERFQQLESSGLLITEAEDGESYRFNALFQRYLRGESVGRSRTSDVDIHDRAARWFVSRGSTLRAIRHHFAAGDPTGAIDAMMLGLIEGHGQVNRSIVTAWIDETDEDQVRATGSPRVFAAYALVLTYAGGTVSALRWLRSAESIGPADSHRTVRLLARAGLETIEGRPAEAIACHEDLQALRSRAGASSDVIEVVLRAGAHLLVDDARGARSALETYEASPPRVHHALLAATEGIVLALEGRLQEAAAVADDAIREAVDEGVGDHLGMTGAWRARALVAYEQGRFGEARAALSAWLGRGVAGVSSLNMLVQTQLAHVEVSDGRMADAAKLCMAASMAAIDPHSPMWDRLTALEARMAMTAGEFGRAYWLVAHMQSPALAALTEARVAVAAGDPVRARDLLRTLETPTQWRHQLDALITRTRVAKRLGDDDGADRYLERALDLAVPELAVTAFFEDGPDLWDAMVGQLQGRSADDYLVTAARLVAQVKQPRLPVNGQLPVDAESGLIAALRPRELQVLRLIGERYANREIATALEISPNTLKTHVRRLYSRLGIRSRAEAIETAQRVLSEARHDASGPLSTEDPGR